MHKIKSLMTPTTFQNKFRKPTLGILQISLYPTTVYHHLNQVSRNVEFQSKAPPTFWNNILTNSEKMQESVSAFKNSMRKNLLELENEVKYF